MPVVDSCIVKDHKCTIIAEFGKKNPAQTADGGLLVRDCLVTLSPFKVQIKCCFFIAEFERAAKIRKIAIYCIISLLVPEL